MATSARLSVGLLSALALFAGCKKPPPPEMATVAPPVAAFGAPPTGQEVIAFARQFEKAVKTGDLVTVQDGLRLDNLIDRCTSDLNLNASFKAGVRKGATQIGTQFASQFTDGAKDGDGGSFKFLRARTSDGKPTAVFRLILAEGGVKYFEITLARHADGKIGSEDIYAVTQGEPMSLAIRRLVLQGAAGVDQQLAGKLGGKDRELLENLPQVSSITKQILGGNHADALATYRKLPLRLQTEKSIQLLGVTAAAEVSEQDYLTEMERFRAAHPNDPSTAMMSIDFHLLRKEYELSLKAIDTLDVAMGGDPYLQSLRATVRLLAGQPAEALAAARKAIDAEPSLKEGYLTAAQAAALQKDHAAALRYYQQAVEKAETGLDLDAIAGIDGLEAFAASPQFAELKQWYEARGK